MTPEAQLAFITMIGGAIASLMVYLTVKANATGKTVATIETKVDGRLDGLQDKLDSALLLLEAANKTAARAEGVIEGTQAEQARTAPPQ